MSNIVVPGGAVSRVTRHLRRAAAVSESPFTFQQQVQIWSGRAWVYDIEFYPQRGADARALDAILNQIGGVSGTFVFEDPTTGRADIAGNPEVSEIAQTGSSMATSGWASSTTVMQAGECFSLGTGATTRLYQLTADAVSDVSGFATLQIQPDLRQSPNVNDPLEVTQPRVLLRLTGPAPASMDPGVFYRFSLSAMEAL